MGLTRKDASTFASRFRNAGSPRVSKIFEIAMPSSSSIHASTSKNGRPSRSARSLPTELLPAPIIPTRTMCSALPEAAEVAIAVAEQLVERVATELAEGLAREHQRGHGLRHDAHGGNGRDVGALLEGHRLFLRLDVDSAEHGAIERRQRLHRHPDNQHLTVRDSALDTARTGRRAAVTALVGIPHDLVVSLGAAPAGHVEALAELDGLHRLDAHQGLREHPVELAVPMHVAAETDRHAVAEHLDDATERVALGLGGLHLLPHGRLGIAVEAAHR